MLIIKLCSKRQTTMLFIKVLLIIIVFGLYFVILLRESMAAMEEGKAKIYKLESNRLKVKQQINNKIIQYNANKTLRTILIQQHQQQQLQSIPQIQVTSSTINPIYEYSEEVNAIAEHEFSERKQQLWDTCVKKKIVNKYSANAWEFLISPGHGLAWCNVFKAASSTWMYYFNILGGYNLSFLRRTNTLQLELARKRFPRPNLLELSDALSSSISFLIVREPFERLLSAYRNKLEGCRNSYYKRIGKEIVEKFRTKQIINTHKMPGPTFREFLMYLIYHHKNGGNFDEHWSPIYSFCTPCSINFTLIAKVETFQRDTEYIIRQAGLETLLLNKLPPKKVKSITNQSTMDTKGLIPKYFSQIDEVLLKDVLEIYELDFDLFGYNSTKYYELVQPSI